MSDVFEGTPIRGLLPPEKVIQWQDIKQWVKPDDLTKIDLIAQAFCWEQFDKRIQAGGFNSTEAVKILNRELQEYLDGKEINKDDLRALLNDPIQDSVGKLAEFIWEQDNTCRQD